MTFSKQAFLNNKHDTMPAPQQIIERFTHPSDCLTAHLMFESAEVMAGVKPANLLSIVNRNRPCGRNLYQLWQDHNAELAMRFTNLSFKVLLTRSQSHLILSFNHDHLKSHLAHAGIRALLFKAGYDKNASMEELIKELSRRIRKQDSFPHEIGLFIGYPAKDVAAFMGLNKLPFTCQGPWKIFGNPVKSLELVEQHRKCRKRMGDILAAGNLRSLELAGSPFPFFLTQD